MFNKKKNYFNGMILDADKVIWDLEFKKFTALNEREVIRKQYDQAQDALSRMSAQTESTPQLEEDKAAVNKRVSDLKRELDAVDATIMGGQPSELLPNGAEGIDNKLRAWSQRREYVKAFVKHNC